MPLQFSIEDIKNPERLELLLRQIQTALESTSKPERNVNVSTTTPQQQAAQLPTNLIRPTITDFSSAQHNHQNAAGGGTLDAAAIQSGVLPIVRGGTGSGTAAGARSNLSAAQIQTPGGPHTVTLAKITGGGSNGSISFNAEGVITAFVDPT